MAAWRKMGTWRKAHNISIYVLASPQWRQEFKRLGAQTILHRQNSTWGNTGYTMIQSMLRNRDAVEVFWLRHLKELENDPLSMGDWEQLADAVTFLEPFHSATLRMEGDFAEPHTIIVELNFLRTTLTNKLQQYQANPNLHSWRAAAEAVVVHYKSRELYTLLTVCVALVIIHAVYKWEYFEVAVDNLEWTDA